MDRQVSLWERWTETAGWLGVRVRQTVGQEGELAEGIHWAQGQGSSLCLGAAAMIGVKW